MRNRHGMKGGMRNRDGMKSGMRDKGTQDVRMKKHVNN